MRYEGMHSDLSLFKFSMGFEIMLAIFIHLLLTNKTDVLLLIIPYSTLFALTLLVLLSDIPRS